MMPPLTFVPYSFAGHPDVRAALPRRADVFYEEGEGSLVIAHACHKYRETFFVLVQTEQGDLFKVTVDRDQDSVLALAVKYFDTVAPAAALTVLRSGFLFVASEVGNHYFYLFKRIGDTTEQVTFKRPDEPAHVVQMMPRPLVNLELIDELFSMGPITDVKVDNLLKEETPQIYAFTGAGTRSALRILRQGMSVSEIAKVRTDHPIPALSTPPASPWVLPP